MVKVFQEMEEKEEEKARIAGSSAHARLSLRVRPVFACTRWPAAASDSHDACPPAMSSHGPRKLVQSKTKGASTAAPVEEPQPFLIFLKSEPQPFLD